MEIITKKAFNKAYVRLPKNTQESIKLIISKLSNAASLKESGVDYKKLEGTKNFYRIRVGDWRIGIQYINPEVVIITVLHRSIAYNKASPFKD